MNSNPPNQAAGEVQVARPLRLSAVVASQNGPRAAATCLEGLERQRPDGVGQIILVENSSDGTAGLVRARFPTVEVVEVADSWLVPRLWGIGAQRARNEVIALLTTQVVAGDGWARGHLQAQQTGEWSAVGGPIDPDPDLGPVDWAVYWMRFGRWGVPSYRGVVSDVAGDNASYRRERIAAFLDQIGREGFWEHELHQTLRAAGGRFFAAPDARVRFVGGNRLEVVRRQRWEHGQRFGAERVARAGRLARAGRVLTWPATPGVFLARLFAHARARGDSARFARSLPVLAGLVAAWSTGELSGYLTGNAGGRAAAAPTKARS